MNKNTLIYGFTIFSMFFGSGNLVFPLKIGYLTDSYWLVGFLGLFCTGIILPFLGLLVIKIYHGNYVEFFGTAGRMAKIILPLFTLSLLGSFGVIPRCITVAYGGFKYAYPDLISLNYFSLIFCSLSYICCLKENIMISFIGKYLTPLLLGCVLFLIVVGILKADSFETPGVEAINFMQAFKIGFLEGYETMDLFAAFFFSALIFSQIKLKNNFTDNNFNIIKEAIKPSIFGALLLAIVYLGFVYLGSAYQYVSHDLSPELILPSITMHLLGKQANEILALIVIIACLTTAIALNNIYAQYLTNSLKLQDKSFPGILLATTLVAFYISLYDFKMIANFLSPILEITYPGLIILTILSLITRKHDHLKANLFYLSIIVSLTLKLM